MPKYRRSNHRSICRHIARAVPTHKKSVETVAEAVRHRKILLSWGKPVVMLTQ